MILKRRCFTGFLSRAMPARTATPTRGFGLTCEITYSDYKPLPCDGQALAGSCISDCAKVVADDAIVVPNQVDMPYAHVVYDHQRNQHVKNTREWVAKNNILLAGRYSEWEYCNSEHLWPEKSCSASGGSGWGNLGSTERGSCCPTASETDCVPARFWLNCGACGGGR